MLVNATAVFSFCVYLSSQELRCPFFWDVMTCPWVVPSDVVPHHRRDEASTAMLQKPKSYKWGVVE